jgi:hypothetical protein
MPRAFSLLVLTVVLTGFVSVVSAASSGTAVPVLLPDLDQEIASQLRVVADPSGVHSYRIGFQSAVRNVGAGPLLIRGRRQWPSTPTMDADQVVQRADGSTGVIGRVGSLRYVSSSDHQHWHYVGFDRYELRRAGNVAEVAGAAPAPVYVGRCGLGQTELLEIEEGISVGYGDKYQAFLEYQDLSLTGLADGRYVLVHRVNVDRRIRELSYANNASSLLLDLRWRDGIPYLSLLRVCPDTARCDTAEGVAASTR